MLPYLGLTILSGQWFWAGLAYGLAIFLVTNFILVPLSAVPSKGKPDFPGFLAMLVFGLIVSACTKWFTSRPGTEAVTSASPAECRAN